jgi:cell shape-determining protein MreC
LAHEEEELTREIEELERKKNEGESVVEEKERILREKREWPTIHKAVTCQIISDKPSTNVIFKSSKYSFKNGNLCKDS